jgi:serine/threonine protein kinase
LKSLHQRNIVHGDLKPSNIFLIDTGTGHDFVKITDFGIAGSFGEEQRHEFLRKSGGSYLSPEQCLGYELDSRSDIYSLGLIMYQVVTGKPFIEGQTPVHTVLKQLNVNCKKGLKESGVPDSIQQIIAKCLEKNRAQRYFSIADLDMDLELASAAQTDLTAFAAQWSDEKTKNTSKPPEDKVKFILSGVICAGVMGCLCLAGLNFINAQNYQNNMAPQLGPSPFVQSNFSPPPIVFANQNLNSDEAVREAERIIQDTSKLTSPYMGGGDAFNASTNTPSSMEPPLQVAETYYKEAISAFQKENPGRKDAEFKTKLAGLWTSLGELYTRATFTSDGNGIFDRKNAVTPTLGTNSMSAYTLYPSYLGLYPNSNLNADDKSAEINFEKAAKLLDNKFDDKSMNLLWDLTYVKFQLGKVDEAIDYQQKILDVLKSQKNPDLANMILSYDNLGRMHMWKSRYKEAIEEFKNARNLDKATYKIPGSSEWTDQVRSDLAYGFFLDGRISEAEKLARKNLALIESRPSEAQNTECQRLNMNILYKIFKLEHKDAEATAIELDAYKKNLAPW